MRMIWCDPEGVMMQNREEDTMTQNNVFGLVREMVATWDRLPVEIKESRKRTFFWKVMDANPDLKASWSEGKLHMTKGLEELGQVLPSVPARLATDVSLAVWYLHNNEECPRWMGGMSVIKQVRGICEWAEWLLVRRDRNPKARWAPLDEFRTLRFGATCYTDYKFKPWQPLKSEGYIATFEESFEGLVDPKWIDEYCEFMREIDDAFHFFQGQYRKKFPSHQLGEKIVRAAAKYEPSLFPEGRRGLPFIADLTV